jgi:uncharacterized protein (DUF486 family)
MFEVSVSCGTALYKYRIRRFANYFLSCVELPSTSIVSVGSPISFCLVWNCPLRVSYRSVRPLVSVLCGNALFEYRIGRFAHKFLSCVELPSPSIVSVGSPIRLCLVWNYTLRVSYLSVRSLVSVLCGTALFEYRIDRFAH